MMAVVFLAARTIKVTDEAICAPDMVLHALDLLLVCIFGLVASLLIGHGWQLTVFGRTMGVHALYTPVLLLTLVGMARLAWPHRHLKVSVDRAQVIRLVRLATVTGLVSAVMLSPVLYAIGVRIRDAGFESSSIFWRSSPSGVDLLTFLAPNPNHPVVPAAVRAWLTPRPDAYLENVASLTFVSLLTIATAIRTGWRPPAVWIAMTVTFGLMSLGPFIHVGGVNTHIPGPWALVRYLPIARLARTPTRLTIVLMLAVSILFAAALGWLGDRTPRYRRVLRLAVALALLFELFPAPRPLYSASVPAFYQRIAADPRDTRVLELPFGIRDGTSSVGDFTARSQFFQTVHGKPLIGGYLSRVSRRRIAETRRDPMLDALITLSEGFTLDPGRERTLIRDGPQFLQRTQIGFVVIDATRTPAGLRDFAVRALQLQRVDGEGVFELHIPQLR